MISTFKRMTMGWRGTRSALLTAAVLVVGAPTVQAGVDTVPKVDLDRFMGPWYVQAHTPTFIDAGTVNQIESYQLQPDGTIQTTFTFYREYPGEPTTLSPKGWVVDHESNAHWKMQFIWPFSSDYLIVRLAPDYSYTVISVPNKDLIWIMTRVPTMESSVYDAIVEDLRSNGYKVESLRRVPQRW